MKEPQRWEAEHLSPETVVQVVHSLLDDYLSASKTGTDKVLQQVPPRQIAEALDSADILSQGFASEEQLLNFIRTYLQHTNHLNNPKYFGHQVAVPHQLSGIPE
ncbi:MAG: hypothetical protein VW892_07870, partial [Flavobacteriaceae bacterium]